MGVVVEGYARRAEQAVAHYWGTLSAQAAKQTAEDADRGRRASVTGGKQMDGFCDLFAWLLQANGLSEASIYRRSQLELPGFFRPTKQWDMLVVHGNKLVAAVEFKSQRGPSFGNNFNNRTEEALGNAADIWTAHREGAFGSDSAPPWLGWLMLLEETTGSTSPVRVNEPHFNVFEEFRGASYAERYAIQLRKLVAERHYSAAGLLMSTEQSGVHGQYTEPHAELGIKQMLASLAGHAATHVARQ